MSGPDYTKYSLEELQDAYNNIDKESYPERVATIEREIEKRGNVRSALPVLTDLATAKSQNSTEQIARQRVSDARLSLRNGFYRNSLITILCLFIVTNGANFIASPSILPVVGLIIQIPLVVFILFRLKRHVTYIRIWGFIVAIGGGAGLVASCSTLVNRSLGGDLQTLHTLSATYFLNSMLRVVLGGLYLMFLNTHLVERTSEPESANEQTV